LHYDCRYKFCKQQVLRPISFTESTSTSESDLPDEDQRQDKPVDKALGLLISESTNGKVKPNLCKIYSQPNNEGPVRLVGIGWAGWFDQPSHVHTTTAERLFVKNMYTSREFTSELALGAHPFGCWWTTGWLG